MPVGISVAWNFDFGQAGPGWHLTNHWTVSTPSQFQRVNSAADAASLLSLFTRFVFLSILRQMSSSIELFWAILGDF